MPGPEISFVYADGAPHFDQRVEAVGRRFMELLFAKPAEGAAAFTAETHPLAEVVHPDFIEITEGRVSLRGLQALVDYRNNFGGPTLLSAEMIAATENLPAVTTEEEDESLATNFSTFTDFRFNLPHGAPQFQTLVRMWESLDIRPAPTPEDPERLMVFGRTYQPLGPNGFLPDAHGQHQFVGDQVAYFTEHGHEMPVTPLREVFADVHPGATFNQAA